MAKNKLHEDWERLRLSDCQLDIAAGKVSVWDEETSRRTTYRLALVYRQLIQQAYEDGRKDRLPYTRP